MILVDAGVWIDYFRGAASAGTDRLNDLLGERQVALADLVLVEVLQGFRSEREFEQARRLLALPNLVQIGGRDMAEAAARNYRALRALGITVRKTVDTLIATYCIALDMPLLYQDRDFDPFVEHLGLTSAL